MIPGSVSLSFFYFLTLPVYFCLFGIYRRVQGGDAACRNGSGGTFKLSVSWRRRRDEIEGLHQIGGHNLFRSLPWRKKASQRRRRQTVTAKTTTLPSDWLQQAGKHRSLTLYCSSPSFPSFTHLPLLSFFFSLWPISPQSSTSSL